LLAIPTAIIGTFIIINWLGFTLNTFSLLGLALAIGVVVDDAIIMLENIVRYGQMGLDKVNAAYKGSREITFAVIATTLALVAIFIPISFMPGIEGRFFLEFAVTISIAVSLSSLEALTLAPMRCSQFLRVGERATAFGRGFDQFMLKLKDIYSGLLNKALERRGLVLLLSLLLFAGSALVFKKLETQFVPPQDRGMVSVMFLAPDGKSMQYTDEKIKEFEKIAMAHPAVQRVFVAIGGFGAGGQGNRGNGIVILKDRKDRAQSQPEVVDDLRAQLDENIKGMKVFIRDRWGTNLGGRRGNPVEYTISGPDPEKQKELFDVMKTQMEDSGLFVGVRSDDARGLPEVQITPNREKAIRSGVEVSEIADVINATFGGVVATNYTQGSRRFPVFVQLQEKDRQRVEDISPILVRNNRGELLPLAQVVDVNSTTSPQYVYREDRIRGVRVDSSLVTGVTEGKAISKVEEIAANVLPEKYFIRFSETPREKLLETVIIMLLGLIIAYMVLASQFNSFLDPWVVFLAIPFGLIGSGIALWLGGQTLNIYSVIGILLTMGIVKKNSILLVEFTNQLRDKGTPLRDAIMEACPIRLRPILMTTVSTLAAALPPALALGPGAETRIPMALTVIGGVLLSALFTLFVVPCVYSLVAPERRKILLED
ncbi:MAG: efflux RND transporter permease subunit, partial [Bdellovibrionales bacterium]|nr:efflux RND transporter permease subunit [Bdellovibrionales bacterium]